MDSNLLVREATANELANWNVIIKDFDNRRIFHGTNWITSIAAFSGCKPLYLIFEKNSDIVGCIPGLIVKIGPIRIFASPMEGWQTESIGPIFDVTKVATNEIFSALIPFIEQEYGVHHIELACKGLDCSIMRCLGFQGEPLLTYRVKISPYDDEKNFKSLPGKTRNQLRKAIKLGLVVKVEEDLLFIDDMYYHLQEVFTRNGITIPFNKNRLIQCFRYNKDNGGVLMISVLLPNENRRIATGMFLVGEGEMLLWQWAHLKSYGWYCPIELLTWAAIQHGAKCGCTSLDMGGGGKAKLKFGAVPDETVYRWIRSRYHWLSQLRHIAKKMYRWQQSFRGRISRRRRFPTRQSQDMNESASIPGSDSNTR